MANNATITMDDLLAGDSVKQLTAGEVITGTILSVRKHEVLVDLGAQGVGVVPRREVGYSRNLAVGDEVTASIVDPELDSRTLGLGLEQLRAAKTAIFVTSGQAKHDIARTVVRGGLCTTMVTDEDTARALLEEV